MSKPDKKNWSFQQRHIALRTTALTVAFLLIFRVSALHAYAETNFVQTYRFDMFVSPLICPFVKLLDTSSSWCFSDSDKKEGGKDSKSKDEPLGKNENEKDEPLGKNEYEKDEPLGKNEHEGNDIDLTLPNLKQDDSFDGMLDEIARLRREIDLLKARRDIVAVQSIPSFPLVLGASTNITESYLNDRLNILENKLMSEIVKVSSMSISASASASQGNASPLTNFSAIALTNKIDQLSGVTLNNVTFTGTQSGISGFLPLTGGTITGTLSVTASTTFNGVEYLFPSADGSASQFLTTNGAGGLSWIAVPASAFTSSSGYTTLTNPSDNVGIGTSSPYAKLAVAGEVVADTFTATSTTATSTFANHISIATGKEYRINGIGLLTRSNTGAFIAGNLSGNARGSNAIDVQSSRSSTQVASGDLSSAFGGRNEASGLASSAFGFSNTASGESSSAFGGGNTASGYYSSAFGRSNTASGYYSSAGGYNNTASGQNSSAFGFGNTASGGGYSYAFGGYNTASGLASSAFGTSNTASENFSSAFGNAVTNNTANSTMIGPSDAAKLTILGAAGVVGNVGIGTTSPYKKLSVAGDGLFDGLLTASSFNATSTGYSMAGTQVVYLPDQADFLGTLVLGDGGQNLSHSLTNDGRYNTLVGLGAGSALTTGAYNTATGYEAFNSNTTGGSNTANGYRALTTNTTGGSNTAVGLQALTANTTGNNNVALGYQALTSNIGAGQNTATGYRTLNANTTGGLNTATGYLALYANISGGSNTALGSLAGRYIADGSTANTTGDFNIFIGGSTKALADDDQNEIVIGYNATGAGSNSVTLGNDSITTTVLRGNVGIGTTSPYSKLSVHANNGETNLSLFSVASSTASATTTLFTIANTGDVTVTGTGGTCTITGSGACSSDIRVKKDIVNLSDSSLEKVINLRPITYRMKYYGDQETNHLGFIAQEVQEIFPEAVTTLNDSVVGEHFGLKYDRLIVPAIKAIQELNLKVDQLDVTDLIDNESLFESMIAWLEDKVLTVAGLKTDTLCVGDTCITEDQFIEIFGAQTEIQKTGTQDTVAPVITISGKNPANISIGVVYKDPGAYAVDDVDGERFVDVEGTNIDTSTDGTHTVVYTARDVAGNVATEERTVIVGDGDVQAEEPEEPIEEEEVIEEQPEEIAEDPVPDSDTVTDEMDEDQVIDEEEIPADSEGETSDEGEDSV